MSWHHRDTLAWAEPLALAAAHAHADMALLYSGLSERFGGRMSYLFLDPLETVEGARWSDLPPLPAGGDGLPLWVGYLGYGMGDDVPPCAPGPLAMPPFRLTRYAHLLCFDHALQAVDWFSQEADAPRPDITPDARHSHVPPVIATPVIDLASNLTRARYESIVAATVERIRAGDFYQANITRKCFGRFAAPPDAWALFARLARASPAPYSAYLRHGDTAILSSSPECFLKAEATGILTTRPIKGSARRGGDPAEDDAIRAALLTSAKNHAENLMITDLMRNDLARVSAPGSVEVVEQSALYSYATIHHLISTIRARRRRDASVYDAVRACFPPGSMTGAPKIAAMRWCATQEGMARGVYSGAIGWFGAGDTCDLSVVIRTLILQDNRFEFQTGGGIVADSTPEDEWRETLVKARGILAALGLKEEDLVGL